MTEYERKVLDNLTLIVISLGVITGVLLAGAIF